MVTLGMTGTKWEIVRSSIELFAKDGYDNVSIKQVAAKIGVSAAAIYYFFPNKDDILVLIYKLYIENYFALFPKLEDILELVGKMHPYEILRKIKFHLFSDNKEESEMLVQILQILMKEKDHDSRANDVIVSLYNGVSEYYEPIIRKMIEMNVIEPLNIEAWYSVFAHYYLISDIRSYGKIPMTYGQWSEGQELIYSLIHVKNKNENSNIA